MGLSLYDTRELLVLENELQRWHSTCPLVGACRERARGLGGGGAGGVRWVWRGAERAG